MNLHFPASVYVSLTALISLLSVAGCQSSPPPDHGMRGFIIDVAASDEWRESHAVYTMFRGERIDLPAYFEFSPRPTNFGHSGKADTQADILYVQFGGILLDIETEDGTKVGFLSDDEDYALKLKRVITWTIQPLTHEHQVSHTAPQSLEELHARIESGELAHYINMQPAAR